MPLVLKRLKLQNIQEPGTVKHQSNLKTMISKQEYIKAKKIVLSFENQQVLERMERIEKIKAELTEFFNNNDVGGVKVTDFDLGIEKTRLEVFINEPPCFEGLTCPDYESIKVVHRIGEKHGENVHFPYYYFPK